MNWGLILDLNAFIFISLSLIYAAKIHRMVKLRSFVWLVIAMAYGTLLRAVHLLRDLGICVPSSLIVSRLFSFFYVLLFLGIMAYYKPIKDMWNGITNQSAPPPLETHLNG